MELMSRKRSDILKVSAYVNEITTLFLLPLTRRALLVLLPIMGRAEGNHLAKG